MKYVSIHSRSDIVDVFRDIAPAGMCGLAYSEALDLIQKIIVDCENSADKKFEIAQKVSAAKKDLIKHAHK